MPLQNRVLPDGEIVRAKWRGMLMGNRGGKLHDPNLRELTKRRWVSKRWIICVCEFKNRQRTVMGPGYTELFFSDEACALAAGHRPCFECQRKTALRFCEIWQLAHGQLSGSKADAMDRVLHQERLSRPVEIDARRLHDLPVGAFVKSETGVFAARHANGFLEWSDGEYRLAGKMRAGTWSILTPPSILNVLQAGYEPVWNKKVETVFGGS